MAVLTSPRKIPAVFAAALSACLAIVFLPLLALPASAVGGFQDNDGDMIGTIDWESVAASVERQDDGTCEGDDTIFGTGSQKNNDTSFNLGCGSVPPNKNDLARAYAYTNTVGDDIFLYLAYALESKTGSAHVDFELNQSADTQAANGILKQRSIGDILISYDWNGSSEIRITRQTWNGTIWGNATALNGTTAAAGVNGPPTQNPGQTITDPIANTTYGPETFGEVGINATAAGFFPNDECRSFGSATPKTRSSGESFQSELKDYIAPFEITLSNCSSVEILKVDEDDEPLAGAEFAVKQGATTIGTCTTVASGLCTISDLPVGSYTVHETKAPLGYFIDTASQPLEVTAAEQVYKLTFENLLGSVRWEKRDKNGQGQPLLGGATFVLTATGGDAQTLGFGPLTVVDNGANDTDATAGEIAVGDLPKGTYSVEETVAPTGFNLSTPNPKTFTVSSPTTVTTLTGTPDPNTASSGAFLNPRKTSTLEVEKFNADKSLTLNGAVFELYRDTNGTAGLQTATDTLVDTCTTAGEGTCSISGLVWGTYYWYEKTPPPGYNFSNTRTQGPIEIDASNAGTTFPATEFTNLKTKLVTEATDANLPGGTISDTATLSGVPSNAGGTITFELYSDASCRTLVYTSPDVNVSGPGTYGGASVFTYTPTQAGSYYWIAEYSGDATNKVVGARGECGDEGETSIVRPAKPGIQTQVSDDSIALPSGTVNDKATIQPVTANATGTVDFVVFDNDQCSGTPVFTSNDRAITVIQGQNGYYAESASGIFTPTEAGTYYWIATYSGDSNNEGVAGECGDPGETVVVDRAQPGISTQVSDDSIALPAGSVSDTATLTGVAAASPQGTVDFAVYGPDDATCSGTPVFTSNDRAVTGAGSTKTSTSATFTPTEAGTYYWIASFSGDANNKPVSGACQDEGETVVVDRAQPGISTQVSDDSIALPAGSVSDTATLTGVAAASPQGTVDFAVYGPDDATCSGTPVFTSNDRAVTGAGSTKTATSATFTPVDAGTYYWIASFSGDANNKPVSGECQDEGETVVVDRAQPGISTQVSNESLGLPNDGVFDTATLTGVVNASPQGTVDFAVYGPNDPTCSGTPVFTSNDRAVTGAGATKTSTSATFTPTDSGTYNWIASFSGDANNKPVAGECGDPGETVSVAKAQPSIATQVSDDSLQLPGMSVSDSASVTNLVPAAEYGTVDFVVYGPSDSECSGDVVFQSLDRELTVVGSTGTASSEAFTPTLAGEYHWIASYSGDANNEAVSGACGDEGENVTVDKADNDIATMATATAALPSGTISDTATITGLNPDPTATGTVDFFLYGIGDTDCSADPVFTSLDRPITIGQDPTTATAASAAFTPKLAGVYRWIAEYSGDANNSGAAGQCNDENENSTVDVAPTDIETLATATATLPDGTISDTATITGLTTDPAATGTVTFELYGPVAVGDEPECTGDPIFTSEKALVGSGATSDPFTPKLAGAYYWIAEYSGDANNAGARGACGDEGETSIVEKAPTSVTTLATPQAILGSEDLNTLSDTATVTGTTSDPAATGTVTFSLYGPDDAECSADPIYTSTVPLVVGDGGVGATSGAFSPTAPGTYLWIAAYSGDANNAPSSGACGDEGETSIVNQPELDKAADREVVAPGGQISYTVTASNIGDLPIEDGVVVDTLPAFVTPVEASISNGGVASLDEGVWTITWTIDIPANDAVALTYTVDVSEDVPEAFDLVNVVTFFDLEADDTVKTPLERDLETLVGDCFNDAPYLFYAVSDAQPGELVTLTFVNPDGENVVLSGLPLEGSVLWPGSEIDAEGNPIDWPGWRFENGQWLEGDEFDWVRPTVTVIVETDGDALATAVLRTAAGLDRLVVVGDALSVDYPDAEPICDAPPVEVIDTVDPIEPEVLGTKLAATGAAAIPMLIGFAVLFLLVGAGAMLTSRRRGEGIL